MANTRAKVATVLGPNSVAINAGTKAGVQEGDLVRFFFRTPITDPDTQKELGAVITTLHLMQVRDAQEQYSIARSLPSGSVAFHFVTDDKANADYNNEYLFAPPGTEVIVETPRREPPPQPATDADLDDLPF